MSLSRARRFRVAAGSRVEALEQFRDARRHALFDDVLVHRLEGAADLAAAVTPQLGPGSAVFLSGSRGLQPRRPRSPGANWR